MRENLLPLLARYRGLSPPWFNSRRKINARNAKLHRLKRKGLAPTKTELVAMAAAAVAKQPIPQRKEPSK